MLTPMEERELSYLEGTIGKEEETPLTLDAASTDVALQASAKPKLTRAEQQELEALELALLEEQGDDLGYGIVEKEPESSMSHAGRPQEAEAGLPIAPDEKPVESPVKLPEFRSQEAMSMFEQALAMEEKWLSEQEGGEEFDKIVDESIEEIEMYEAVSKAEDWSFYKKIGDFAETDHGDTPVDTNDAAEANKAVKSKDVGFGHKVKPEEASSGLIHGIQFIDDKGNYIPLTQEQKSEILGKDMEAELNLALNVKNGWNEKLSKLGITWEHLSKPYRLALTSLAFNVGGAKAGKSWSKVLKAAKDKDLKSFAKELRRKDSGRFTHGMDNRVAKELYYAGLIKSLDEVSSWLPLATSASGVPQGELDG